MTDDHTPPAAAGPSKVTPDQAVPLPDDAVQAAAEVCLRQYDSEYNASHLTWRDFADETREVLTAAAPALRDQGAAAERERWRQVVEIQKRTYESNREPWSDQVAAALGDLADVIPGFTVLKDERERMRQLADGWDAEAQARLTDQRAYPLEGTGILTRCSEQLRRLLEGEPDE